jgi:hypothetical protein
MMTIGPWRPVHLDTYTHRFEDVRVDTDLLGPDYSSANLKARLDLGASPLPSGSSLKAILRNDTGSKIKEETVKDNKLDWKFEKGQVEGWYPINYGKQPLYNLDLTLADRVSVLTSLVSVSQIGQADTARMARSSHRLRPGSPSDMFKSSKNPWSSNKGRASCSR